MRNLRTVMLKSLPVILSGLLLVGFALSGRLSSAVRQVMNKDAQPSRLKASAMIAPLALTAAVEPQSPVVGIRPTTPLPSGYIPLACSPYVRADTLLDCWLLQHPTIANSIAWEFEAQGGGKAWPQWNRQAKDDLRAAFVHARNWFQNGMTHFPGTLVQDPPTNLTDGLLMTNQPAYLVISQDDAWGLYLGHVGLSLAAEIYGVVPWSLRNYDARALGHLFNAYTAKDRDGANNSNMFRHSKGDAYDNYVSDGAIVTGMTPANASYVFKFLKDHDLIGPTPKETIARLLEWSAGLSHFIGDRSSANAYNHWQYYGQTMSRTIEGTLKLDDPNLGKRHWTGGCGGTSGFVVWALRVVNVPVKGISVLTQPGTAHGGIWFSGENLFISHGDAPYDNFAGGYPPALLLLNEQTFDSWFKEYDSSITPSDYANNLKNIDRRVTELAVKYPGSGLVRDYCQDLNDHKSHADGKAYQRFKPFYSVRQLEAWGLWDRLEQKANGVGGCQP